jgi:hypothetical protein
LTGIQLEQISADSPRPPIPESIHKKVANELNW